jgi:hypothetical protein
MRVPALVVVVIAAFANIVLGLESSAEPPITLEDLNRRTVIGKLGLPLGTVVEIDAEITAGSDLRLKGYHSHYLLKVTHVDGKKMDSPPLLDFSVPGFASVKLANHTFSLYEMKHGTKAGSLNSSQVAELEKDYVGRAVRLLVYEVGSFDGMPKNLPKDMRDRADFGFHFSTSLIALAQREKPTETSGTKR